jgi:hypothetical protein
MAVPALSGVASTTGCVRLADAALDKALAALDLSSRRHGGAEQNPLFGLLSVLYAQSQAGPANGAASKGGCECAYLV